MTQQDIQPSEGPERPLDPPESDDKRPAFEDYPIAEQLRAVELACEGDFYWQAGEESLSFCSEYLQYVLDSSDVSDAQIGGIVRAALLSYIIKCAAKRGDDLRDYIT